MTGKFRCSIFSFDYLDYDVFLNVQAFYRLAGYSVSSDLNISALNLLIVLRGIPPRIYNEFTGIIHYYDYVKEHSYNPNDYFPNASAIYYIGIESLADKNLNEKSTYITAYLPIISSLWQFSLPFGRRSNKLIHISNYKPLQNDTYQKQLINLIRNKKVKVYGSKWDKINISAKPLTYLSANLKLASCMICFGLMYPYQRGKSLSGRMWQAPLQGCIVISEEGTNLYECPGVIEVSSFLQIPNIPMSDSSQIAHQASRFWWNKTFDLADALGLSLDLKELRNEIIKARILLFAQHINFLWKLHFGTKVESFICRARAACDRIWKNK
jgi:hypothetical protein